ncbi:hypothetical protein ACFLTP_01665 [Chloroflexota bacterium]
MTEEGSHDSFLIGLTFGAIVGIAVSSPVRTTYRRRNKSLNKGQSETYKGESGRHHRRGQGESKKGYC